MCDTFVCYILYLHMTFVCHESQDGKDGQASEDACDCVTYRHDVRVSVSTHNDALGWESINTPRPVRQNPIRIRIRQPYDCVVMYGHTAKKSYHFPNGIRMRNRINGNTYKYHMRDFAGQVLPY